MKRMLSSLKKKFFREEGFFSTKMQRTRKHVVNEQQKKQSYRYKIEKK